MPCPLTRVALLTFHEVQDPLDGEGKQRLLYAYFEQWDDDLQPALGEVQLMASSSVADLADRVSGALMDLTSNIERRGSFEEHYPAWFQTQDLIQVLRNAMREELGLPPVDADLPRDLSWPWLTDRPSRESYVQHIRGRTKAEGAPRLRTRRNKVRIARPDDDTGRRHGLRP